MEISAALAAELALLADALGTPRADIADTLGRLASDAGSAVGSYVGLSVAMATHGNQVVVTVLEAGLGATDVRTSVLLPLAPAADVEGGARIALVLFAAVPGAFVDLSADLAWLTGQQPEEFRLDEHLGLAGSATGSSTLGAISVVNQALGVLIGDGLTPEEADLYLDARAVELGVDRVAAATLVLAALDGPGPGPVSR